MRERREIRGHQGPRAVQALRFVDFRDVLLHLWRLFRALSAWEIAGGDLWKDAFRCYLSIAIAVQTPSWGLASDHLSKGAVLPLVFARRIIRAHGRAQPW
jgi:hypothetical protein